MEFTYGRDLFPPVFFMLVNMYTVAFLRLKDFIKIHKMFRSVCHFLTFKSFDIVDI